MTSTLLLRSLGLAMLGTLLAATSFAQDSGYFYGGLALGQSRANIDQQRITSGLLAGGLGTTAMRVDERDTGYKLFGGYQFTPNLALEGGYFSLGKFAFTSTTVPAGTLSGQIRLQGLNLDLVGTLPLGERWSAIGRVGAQVAQARDRFGGTGAVAVAHPNPGKREANYKLGLGLQYEVNPSMLVRGEVERYRINDAVGNHGGVNMVSLSLVFPFGRSSAQAPRVAAAAASVAPAPVAAPAVAPPVVVAVAPAPPPPAPAPPVAMAAPPPQRVSLSADSLFGFDQSAVRPDGRAALDRLAEQVKGTGQQRVMVEGHTDRLGSQYYNQRLSARRAEAVKAYLVDAGGFDASRIVATGRGESAPVTRPGDCVGSQPSARLIACLQADRRVEVEFTGTR